MPKLSIDIEARLASFQDSLDKIEKQTQGLVGNITQAFEGLSAAVGGFGVALAAVKFTQFVHDAIDAADNLNKMSQRVGVTVESLSELQYAAKLSDVSNEALADGLKKLSVNAQDAARNGGDVADAFKQLGISQKELASLTPEQLLRRVADAYSNLEDGAGKTANAVKIGGRSFNELIPLLNGGARGLDDAAQEARQFGLVVGTEAAQAAERFNDNLTRIQESTRGLAQTLAAAVLPSITKLTEEMVQGIKIFGSFGSALYNIGVAVDPFKSLGENMRKYRLEIEELQAKLADPTRIGTRQAQIYQEALDTAQKRLEFLKFQERAAIPGAGAAGQDARDLALAQGDRKGTLPTIPEKMKNAIDQAAGPSLIQRYVDNEFIAKLDAAERDRQRIADEFKRQLEQGNETDRQAAEAFQRRLDGLFSDTYSGQAKAIQSDLLVLNDALVIGKINAEQYDEAFQKIEERFNRLNGVPTKFSRELYDQEEAFRRLEAAVRGWGNQFNETVVQMIKKGQFDFSKFVDSILTDMVRLVTFQTITQPVFNQVFSKLAGLNLFGSGGGTPSAGIGPGAGQGLQLKGYASGGAFPAGVPMMVGERGPEILVPRTAGTIIPNGGMGGNTIIVNAAPGVDAATVYRAVTWGIDATRSSIARDAVMGRL